jgi:hypothetical protein
MALSDIRPQSLDDDYYNNVIMPLNRAYGATVKTFTTDDAPVVRKWTYPITYRGDFHRFLNWAERVTAHGQWFVPPERFLGATLFKVHPTIAGLYQLK